MAVGLWLRCTIAGETWVLRILYTEEDDGIQFGLESTRQRGSFPCFK